MKKLICLVLDHKKRAWYQEWSKTIVMICERCNKSFEVVEDGLNTHFEWRKHRGSSIAYPTDTLNRKDVPK